jgi:peptidylprolyl isomerase
MSRAFLIVIGLCLPASATSDGVVGGIGDVTITGAEIRELLDSASALAGGPVGMELDSLKDFVRATLVQRLLLDRARLSGHADKPEVAIELQRARDAALVESFLRATSEPPPGYPDDSEVAAFYEQNREVFQVPKTWRLAQIFISDDDPAATHDAAGKLARVREALAAPSADFASIARRFSDDLSSAPDGGDLGWVRDDLIQPGIRAVLPGLNINNVSDPVRLDNGWHILRLVDARETHIPPLAELAPRIRTLLRSKKARENREAYLAEMLAEHPPAINEIELLKLK